MEIKTVALGRFNLYNCAMVSSRYDLQIFPSVLVYHNISINIEVCTDKRNNLIDSSHL